MPRIPLPAPEEMTPEQRRVHDGIVAGPRGTVIGPLRAVIHNPDLAERWSAATRPGAAAPATPTSSRRTFSPAPPGRSSRSPVMLIRPPMACTAKS